jgi:hypothetical protein
VKEAAHENDGDAPPFLSPDRFLQRPVMNGWLSCRQKHIEEEQEMRGAESHCTDLKVSEHLPTSLLQ